MLPAGLDDVCYIAGDRVVDVDLPDEPDDLLDRLVIDYWFDVPFVDLLELFENLDRLRAGRVANFDPHEKSVDLRLRSEEHTSNSSHVAISYAVFCLKKKIQSI